MKKILYILTLLATMFASDALIAFDQVYVENDTPNPIAIGLYRTKDNHNRLDFTSSSGEGLVTRSYKLPTGETVPLEKNFFYILSPGEGVQLDNPSRESGKDRDVWFSYSIDKFARSLAKGVRVPAQISYKNVGSFVKSVYIGDPGTGKLEAFSSRDKALNAGGVKLVREQLHVEGMTPVRMVILDEWLANPEPAKKLKKPRQVAAQQEEMIVLPADGGEEIEL